MRAVEFRPADPALNREPSLAACRVDAVPSLRHICIRLMCSKFGPATDR